MMEMPCRRTLGHLGWPCSWVTLQKASTVRKHSHNEHNNRGWGGGCQVEGVDEVSGCKWSAIHKAAGVQAQCMTWLLAYFDVSWVVHGGPGRKCHARVGMP